MVPGHHRTTALTRTHAKRFILSILSDDDVNAATVSIFVFVRITAISDQYVLLLFAVAVTMT